MRRFILLVLIIFSGTLALLRTIAPGNLAVPGDMAVTTLSREQSSGASQPARSAPYSNVVKIKRSPDSHFRTTVMINGVPISMLVDSGATTMALSRDDAEKIGIFASGDNDFTATAQTASGSIRVKPVILSRVAVGGIERRDIQAAVLDSDLGMSLLGQSFLSKIDRVTISGDEMILE